MIEQLKDNNFPIENYASKLDNRIILIEKNKIKVFPKITELINNKQKIQNKKMKEFYNNELNEN